MSAAPVEMQSRAGLPGIDHSPHLPESPEASHRPVNFRASGEEFFFHLPETQCLDQNPRITGTTPSF